jgi:hypothetical protein
VCSHDDEDNLEGANRSGVVKRIIGELRVQVEGEIASLLDIEIRIVVSREYNTTTIFYFA